MSRVPLRAVPENVVASRRGKVEEVQAIDDVQFREWRRQWKRLMACSVIYFDGIDPASLNTIRGHLTLLGTRFHPFFERSVTHVVTRRSPEGNYARGDVLFKAKRLGMKVWTVDKLVRFLTSLLGYSPTRALDPAQSAKLSQLLRQEKLSGPSDRDQTAHRDDYYYFKHPYVLVWDPSHYNRPILHREWTGSSAELPQLRSNTPGMCPFILDNSSLKRRKSSEAAKKRRVVDDESKRTEGTSTTPPATVAAPVVPSASAENPATTTATQESFLADTPRLLQHACVSRAPPLATKLNEENTVKDPSKARFFELVASGMQRYSATSATRSVATQSGGPGNGLDAPTAFASREVASLQRKVLPPPPVVVPAPVRAKSKKPGFCENCLERFDHFDDHVTTKKHRKYAANTHNFEALDSVIQTLQRPLAEASSNTRSHDYDAVPLANSGYTSDDTMCV